MDLDPAPGGLGLVQDLVNTATSHPASAWPDLLADATSTQDWLDEALAAWAHATGAAPVRIELGPRDAAPTRRLRAQVRDRLAPAGAPAGPPTTGAVALAWGPDGHVGYGPHGSGVRALAGLVVAEVLLSQRMHTWDRLKTCASEVCGVAFYDRSPNVSRTWHDADTCGNRHNLRASRARRAHPPSTPD